MYYLREDDFKYTNIKCIFDTCFLLESSFQKETTFKIYEFYNKNRDDEKETYNK